MFLLIVVFGANFLTCFEGIDGLNLLIGFLSILASTPFVYFVGSALFLYKFICLNVGTGLLGLYGLFVVSWESRLLTGVDVLLFGRVV